MTLCTRAYSKHVYSGPRTHTPLHQWRWWLLGPCTFRKSGGPHTGGGRGGGGGQTSEFPPVRTARNGTPSTLWLPLKRPGYRKQHWCASNVTCMHQYICSGMIIFNGTRQSPACISWISFLFSICWSWHGNSCAGKCRFSAQLWGRHSQRSAPYSPARTRSAVFILNTAAEGSIFTKPAGFFSFRNLILLSIVYFEWGHLVQFLCMQIWC